MVEVTLEVDIVEVIGLNRWSRLVILNRVECSCNSSLFMEVTM